MASWLSSLAEVGNQLLGVEPSEPTGKDESAGGITVYANGVPSRSAYVTMATCSFLYVAGDV